jgi:gamma-D-glutamyl-L-lysine dipeptidyl-peptidase
MNDPRLRELGVPVTTLWAAAAPPGERLTQLLMGEPVLVLEERGGWSHVAAPWQGSSRHERGYPGWVRSSHLADPVDRPDGPAAYVDRLRATCALTGGPAVDLSLGTVLRVDSADERTVTVCLPGGRRGELPTSSVRLSDGAERPAHDPAPALDAARAFLGLGYLWGGTSAWGIDCSGLVHLAWRSRGVLLPRDAHDQAAAESVEEVSLEQVRAGDLYFFARPGRAIHHVGMATGPVLGDGTRWMLHAPETGALVEEAPLAPHRLDTLVAAGRVRGD